MRELAAGFLRIPNDSGGEIHGFCQQRVLDREDDQSAAEVLRHQNRATQRSTAAIGEINGTQHTGADSHATPPCL